MSIMIGKNRNYALNKYLLFDIVSSVFSTYQAIQLLTKLCKKSRKLLRENQEIVMRLSDNKHLGIITDKPDNCMFVTHLQKVPILALMLNLTAVDLFRCETVPSQAIIGQLETNQLSNGFKKEELLKSLSKVLKLKVNQELNMCMIANDQEVKAYTNLQAIEIEIEAEEKDDPMLETAWDNLALNIRKFIINCPKLNQIVLIQKRQTNDLKHFLEFFNKVQKVIFGREQFQIKIKLNLTGSLAYKQKIVLLDLLLENQGVSAIDFFDQMLGIESLSKMSALKDLNELVLFPVTEVEYFSKAMKDLTFKQLKKLHIGILIVDEEAATNMLNEIAESCPQLQILKLDFYQLLLSQQDTTLKVVQDQPLCQKRSLQKLKLTQFLRTCTTLKEFDLMINDEGKGFEPLIEIPINQTLPIDINRLVLGSSWAISLMSEYMVNLQQKSQLKVCFDGARLVKNVNYAFDKLIQSVNNLMVLEVSDLVLGGCQGSVIKLIKCLKQNKNIKVLKLENLKIDHEILPVLEEFALYNESVEVLSLKENSLTNISKFFKNLNTNWLSRLSELDLSYNCLSTKDLQAFCDINEQDSKPLERLHYVLRFIKLTGNPLTTDEPTCKQILQTFYLQERKTMIFL